MKLREQYEVYISSEYDFYPILYSFDNGALKQSNGVLTLNVHRFRYTIILY